MAQDEPVQVDDGRKAHLRVLCHPEGDQHVIKGLLPVLDKVLNPAAVAGGHDVAVIVPDAQRPGKGPVGHGHDDWKSHRGGDEQDFVHQGQPLAGRGREASRPGSRTAHDGAHGAVFTLYADVLCVQVAVGHQLREVLDNMGLRRDRIGRNHIGVGELDCLGNGNADLHSDSLGHQRNSSSSTISKQLSPKVAM